LAIPTLTLHDENKTLVQVQVGVSFLIFAITEIDEKKEVYTHIEQDIVEFDKQNVVNYLGISIGHRFFTTMD
jgi:hypothetical protein